MKELFNEVLNLKGVQGVVLLSAEGKLIFEQFSSPKPVELDTRDWSRFILALTNIREMDFVFESGRLYIRKCEPGYLIIVTGNQVTMALLRLNCDILLPVLQQAAESKKLKKLFKK